MSMLTPGRCRIPVLRHLAASTLLAVAAVPQAHAQAPTAAAPSTTLTLDAALDYALQHYPTVKAAVEQITAATAGADVARAAYMPKLDAMWQINRATANNLFGQVLPQSVIPSMSGPVLASASGDSVWGSAVGALLSWEALDFGLRGASVREAEAGISRARSDEALTRLLVQNAVGAAFLTVVSAEQSQASADADVTRREVLARSAHVLADNQLRPGADASRADAEYAAAQTRAIQARQAVAIGRATLARVLGLSSGTVAVDGSRLVQAVPAAAAGTGSAEAHPAVRSRQAAVDLSRAREDVLQKTDRPRVLLQSALFARGTGAEPDGTFLGGTNGLWFDRANWAAGVQLVFPNVFDVRSLRARRAEAAATTRVENARREEALLDVTAQQQTAQAIVDAAVAIARNTPVQLAAARQSETQARARYDAGLASITEVAEAQSLLAVAEYQDAVARVDVWRALLAQAIAQGDISPFIDRVRGQGVQ